MRLKLSIKAEDFKKKLALRDGRDGIDGLNGLNGVDGLPGSPGKDGKSFDPIVLEEIYTRLDRLEKKPGPNLGTIGINAMRLWRSRHIDEEIPTGTINGSNVTFTLSRTPNPALSLKLILNGARQKAAGTDFTLSNRTITFVTAPPTNSTLIADFRY